MASGGWREAARIARARPHTPVGQKAYANATEQAVDRFASGERRTPGNADGCERKGVAPEGICKLLKIKTRNRNALTKSAEAGETAGDNSCGGNQLGGYVENSQETIPQFWTYVKSKPLELRLALVLQTAPHLAK